MTETPKTETRTQYWLRRSRELGKQRKPELTALCRRNGHVWSMRPLEKWTKEELINRAIGLEWDRLPETQKIPDPPRLSPPCDVCGTGQHATVHGYKGDHNYTYTANPDAIWVPESEAEAERLAQLAQTPPAQNQS